MATFESFWKKPGQKPQKLTCDPCRVFPKTGFLVISGSTRRGSFVQIRSCLFGKNGSSLRPKNPTGDGAPYPRPHPHFCDQRSQSAMAQALYCTERDAGIGPQPFPLALKVLGTAFSPENCALCEKCLPQALALAEPVLGGPTAWPAAANGPLRGPKRAASRGDSLSPFWPTGDGLGVLKHPSGLVFRPKTPTPDPTPTFSSKSGVSRPKTGYSFGVWDR